MYRVSIVFPGANLGFMCEFFEAESAAVWTVSLLRNDVLVSRRVKAVHLDDIASSGASCP